MFHRFRFLKQAHILKGLFCLAVAWLACEPAFALQEDDLKEGVEGFLKLIHGNFLHVGCGVAIPSSGIYSMMAKDKGSAFIWTTGIALAIVFFIKIIKKTYPVLL